MKKILVTLITGLFLITGAFAQNQERVKPTPEERAKKHVHRLSDSIELSQSQKDSLLVVIKEFNIKKDELREKELSNAAKKAEMKTLKAEKDAKINAILHDEAKFAKYKSMAGKHGKKGHKHRGHKKHHHHHHPDSEKK